MCLVAIAWKTNPQYPLLISANRDEFFQRPTAPLHQWDSGVFAGKDLQSGGTWMGFHPNGKWALVTNYRDFTQNRKPEISRGKLVSDFLEKEISPEEYLVQVAHSKEKYDGFNLLVSDGDSLHYFSNYGQEPSEVKPGIHGLSNGLLNSPWPKTELAKTQLDQVSLQNPSENQLLKILKSTETYPLENLPKTGAPPDMEIQLSAQLIRITPNYGTVSASAVLRDRKGLTQIKERSFDWDFKSFRDSSFSFQP
ncbi:NRDE family protein [Algoriphagus mannitolivorans]|uniref:NRDE family protein n=1 Tax=Algoriphagus mannitolivorans TaxID=226504 RepID=UPI0003FDA2E9|nr:NRDE family protein [Algoriphagus mannitolivorans]